MKLYLTFWQHIKYKLWPKIARLWLKKPKPEICWTGTIVPMICYQHLGMAETVFLHDSEAKSIGPELVKDGWKCIPARGGPC